MKLYRVTFAAGLAVGFVLGAREGRERYDQMVKLAKATRDNPTVQQAAGAVQAQAATLFTAASQKVSAELHDRVPQLAQSAVHKVEDYVPLLKNRDGHGGAAGNGGKGAGDGRPFAATSNSHPRRGRKPGADH
jgi:hypothetical protein